MSDTEEEWTTVRRRRGGRSGVTKQLKALAIPVVPLAFDALAEPEEQPAQDTTKAKKKKKGKKAKAAVAGDEDEEEDGKADAASGAPAAAGKGPAKTGAAKSTGGGSKAAQQSLFAWLLSRLVALLVMLGLMRATGTNKKKRKSKAAGATTTAGQKAAAATEEVKAPPATPAKVAADTAAAAPKAAAPVVPAASKQQQQQQQQPAAKPAPAGGSATPAKKPAEVAPAKVVPAAAAAGKAASTAAATAPAPPAAAAAAVATPPPPATPEPKAAAAAAAAAAEGKPKPAEPPPAPATPAAPPPPAIKYDADWGRGKFVMQSLPTAHADVVAAVALAGDIAVSAGYDGAVKLWHWPTPGSQGGGVAPRLAVSRVLVGHSGRVEALAAHAGGRRLATSGRDSSLKVWDLGNEPGGSGAGELASTYVYESVRSLAADWTGDGGAAAGRVLLGARSGTVLLYSLGAGGAGRKVAALRGHQDEVTALQFLYGSAGGQVAVSGARDGTVRLWDLRTAGGAATAVLTGLSGRVCSLSPLGEHHLAAGDCSSTVKLWDLRQLPPSAPTRGSASPPPPPPRRLPNAPGFAGSSCPTAGLWQGPRSGVLLSSCIAWWTSNKQALEEAPPNAKIPMACVNISAFGPPAAAAATTAADPSDLLCQYQYTLRLGLGVVTCLAGGADEGAVLAGGASGALWALRLVRGGSAAAAAAERAAAAAAEAMAAAAAGGDGAGGGGGSCEVVDALVVGAEEFSDDEYDDDDEEEEEDE